MTASPYPPGNASVGVVRPMFQLIGDRCVCDLAEGLCLSTGDVMRVPAEQYERTDRIFL